MANTTYVPVADVTNALANINTARDRGAAISNAMLDNVSQFAGDLQSFASTIRNSMGGVSINIDVPAAPTFEEPPKPAVFTPSVLEFGAEPTLTNTNSLPTLSFGDAPNKDYGDAPQAADSFNVPVPNNVPTIQVPSMPTKPALATPTMGTLTVPSFGEFTKVAPTYDPTHSVAPLFTGDIREFVENPDTSVVQILLDHRSMLNSRIINGGTGLPADIETAIWNRERDRESAVMRSAEEDVLRQDAALGFPVPSGTAQAKLYRVRADYSNKLISLGRDIAIKQAQLEIDNIQKALELLTPIEAQMVQYDTAARQRALEAVKFNNEAAIQIYDVTVKAFMTAQEARKIGVEIFTAQIQAYEAEARVYTAQIEAEKAKVEVNKELIAQYIAELSVNNMLLEAYKSEIEAAVSTGRMEELKIKIFDLQISAFNAQVQAYQAKLQGKTAEVQVYAERVKAYQVQMQGYSTEVEATAKEFEARAAQFRLMQETDKLRVEMYKVRTDANVAKQSAEINYASVMNQANASYSSAIASYNNVHAQVWGASAQAHISAQTVASQVAKMNLDAVQASKSLSLDATKAASAVYSQLISSFLSQQHYQVSSSGNSQLSASVQEVHTGS